MDQKISTPPATPVADEAAKQADQVAAVFTSTKKVSEPVHSVDDSPTTMMIKGTSVTILNDSSRLAHGTFAMCIIL